MRPSVSADLRFVVTPSGALAGVECSGVVSAAPDVALARLAAAETGMAWAPGVGEVVALAGCTGVAVSRTLAGDRGTVTATRGERVVFSGSGDLAEVLRVAAAWRRGTE